MNVSVGVLGVGTVQKVTAPASLSIGVKGEDSYLIRYTTENIGVRVDGGVGVKVTLRFGAGTSGSGAIDIADADTLDGYHAEAFARKAEAAHILEAWRFLKKIGIGFEFDEQIEAYLHNNYDSILNGPVLMGDYVRSRQGFQEGFGGYGWEIDRDGNMTIESLVVRKALKVYELIINQIRATNGSLWVSDSAEILTVTGNTANSYLCRIDSDKGNIVAPFEDGDIVRCQRWTGRGIKYYTGVVLSVSSDIFVLEVIDGTDAPEAKDPVVRIGNRTDGNRQGALYLTASDEGAPYMDVMDGVTDASFVGKIKARLGKLSGLNYNGKPLTGYGLFAELAYLTGAIRNANGKWALNEDGSGSLASGAITWTAEGKLTITGVPKDVSDAINGALTKFINEEYSQAIQNINTQLDKKAETFYQTGMPHAEFIGIDTNAEYDKWVNDMWYNSDPTVRKSYLYTKRVNANNAAKVDYVWAYMDIPKELFDQFDGKKTIYTAKPSKYAIDDIWITESDTVHSKYKKGEILVSGATRTAYQEGDWISKVRYTDDSLAESKSQTYYTDWFFHPQTGESYDPAAAWTTNEEKNKHVGDSWIAHDGTYSVTDGITRTAQHTKIYRLIDGTYSWVRTETTINGGQIETGSVKADRIDVTDLFTKELTATNFNAKGGSVGNFTINQKLVGESSGNIIELDPDAASIKIISSDNRIIRFMPGPLSSVDDITMDNFSWQNTITNDINTVALSQNQLKANKTNWVALAYNTKYCGKNGTQSYWNSAIPADSYQFQLGVAGQKSDYTITIPTILLQKHNGKTSNGRNYKRHGNLKLELVTTIFNADGTVVTSQAYTNEVFIDDRSQDTLLFGGVHRFQVRTTGIQKFYIQIKSKLCGDLTYQRWYTGTFESYWTTLESEPLQFAVGTNQNFKIAGAMGITEISTNGIQTVWSKEAFFRIDGDQFGGKFIETKGLWNHNGYNITTLANDVGQLQSDLQNYYTKTETGNTFALKAHKHLWADIDEKPVTFTPSAHSHQQSEIASTSGWISTELGKKLNADSFSDLFEKKVDGSGNIYIQAKYTLASTGGLAAYTAANINVPSVFDALPIASAVSLGGIKVGTNLTIDGNGVLHAQAGGVSSWADLSNKPVWLNYATQAAFEGGHGHTWGQVSGKPATFTPSAHTHLWADLTDKPATFAPSAHSHAQTDIATTGWITTALANKAASSHTHTIANITNLQTTLDGKANAAHNHAQADIDSAAGWISTALAGKQAAGSYLTTTGQAYDSARLGGVAAGSYARKDVDETFAGEVKASIFMANYLGVLQSGGVKYHIDCNFNGFNIAERYVADYRLFIQDGGNVGIGTGSPTEKLHVSGNIRATGALKSTSIELLNASGVMQYRFTTSGTDCLIANAAGTTIGKIDQSGNLMTKGNITAFATI